MSGAEAAVAALQVHGIDTVFGLPGFQLDQLFCALHDRKDRLRVINARHEQGVAYMALGYAQATGRAGVYAVVPGPGFLNTTAALSTAYACGAPVLALVGQIETAAIGRGSGEFHELPDQSGVLERLTRWCGLASRAHDVPALLAEAFGRLAAGQAPVGVELPMDVLAQSDAIGTIKPQPRPAEPAIDREAVRAAAKVLDGARAPLIFVGGGAIDAAGDLKHVAEFLQSPVVSHRQGRGILDSRDPLSIGPYEGSKLWAGSDVVLAVGTRFHSAWKGWHLRPGQKVIRIDRDTAQFSRGGAPDLAITGDAKVVLSSLAEELEWSGRRHTSRKDELARLKLWAASQFERRLAPQMAFVGSLRSALPDDAILVADYTQVGYVAAATFPVDRPRRMITPGYQGTLGFAFATALGAKVACPDRAVVALVGDGGFLFTANELATAVMHGIRTVTIVFVDGAYGNVRRAQEIDYGGKVIASDLHNPDFVRFAESFGAAARCARTPDELVDCLAWAMAQDVPAVIEVPVANMPDPWALLEPVAA
ncbi:MAG: hypothetical protein JO273_05430 [Methylobacteriaceae bacterium]|nr:hypothetical protein [Methylobacteriaceae bacterium]